METITEKLTTTFTDNIYICTYIYTKEKERKKSTCIFIGFYWFIFLYVI